MRTVPETFFRQQPAPSYREDCQCVPASFCDALDVVLPFTSDIRQFLDARTKGSDILSNATLEDTLAEEEAATNTTEEIDNPIRRGRVLGLAAERVYVNADNETVEVEETATEAVTEAETEEPVTEEAEAEAEETVTEATETEEEASRVRRDIPLDLEGAESAPVPNDRQGVSVTQEYTTRGLLVDLHMIT